MENEFPATDRAPRGAAEEPGNPIERIDLRGLKCPLPVLKAAKRLGALTPGSRLEILSDDPLAGIDIPLFCKQEGHHLIEQDHDGANGHRFLVERGRSAS